LTLESRSASADLNCEKGGHTVSLNGDLRILLVDDEPALRELLRVTFEGADIGVTEAASGEEALALLAARRPDAVVLDLRLPGIGGADLCRRLRRDDATRDIPIVVLSGGDSDELERACKAGADEVIGKPFTALLVRICHSTCPVVSSKARK